MSSSTSATLSLPVSVPLAQKRAIYSPNDLLQLAPFSSLSASSSAASSQNPSPFSATFSIPSLPSSLSSTNSSMVSVSQKLLLSRLQNFPDILAPSAAETLLATSNVTTSGSTATAYGNGPSTRITTTLFGMEENHDDDDDGDEESEKEEEEEEEDDGFVYGESNFSYREDLGFYEVELLKKAVRNALLGGRGRGRRYVVWQAQTPRTPSRAASPVRTAETTTAAPLIKHEEEEKKKEVVETTMNATTTTIVTTKPTTAATRPVIFHTTSSQPPVLVTRASNNNRSRSRSGTLFSNTERGGVGVGGGNGTGATNVTRPGVGVWRSRTLMARQQQQQQQQQQRNQKMTWDGRKTNGVNGKEAEVTSWRRLECGSEWKWNERSSSYDIVKV